MRTSMLVVTALAFGGSLFANGIGQSAIPCPTASLQTYLSAYQPGIFGGKCQIGQLVYDSFQWSAFSVLDNGTSTIFSQISTADIMIVPVSSRNSFDIKPIASKPDLFNLTIGTNQRERYFFGYRADPPPIIAGDELYLDPPVGKVYASKWICTDQEFAQGNPVDSGSVATYIPGLKRADYSASTFRCADGSNPVYIKADGDLDTPSILERSSVFFDEPAFKIDVRILLDYEEGSVAGFQGTETTSFLVSDIPEPATNIMMAGALLGLTVLSRLRRKG
jgi:hypothetical protein